MYGIVQFYWFFFLLCLVEDGLSWEADWLCSSSDSHTLEDAQMLLLSDLAPVLSCWDYTQFFPLLCCRRLVCVCSVAARSACRTQPLCHSHSTQQHCNAEWLSSTNSLKAIGKLGIKPCHFGVDSNVEKLVKNVDVTVTVQCVACVLRSTNARIGAYVRESRSSG